MLVLIAADLQRQWRGNDRAYSSELHGYNGCHTNYVCKCTSAAPTKMAAAASLAGASHDLCALRTSARASGHNWMRESITTNTCRSAKQSQTHQRGHAQEHVEQGQHLDRAAQRRQRWALG